MCCTFLPPKFLFQHGQYEFSSCTTDVLHPSLCPSMPVGCVIQLVARHAEVRTAHQMTHVVLRGCNYLPMEHAVLEYACQAHAHQQPRTDCIIRVLFNRIPAVSLQLKLMQCLKLTRRSPQQTEICSLCASVLLQALTKSRVCDSSDTRAEQCLHKITRHVPEAMCTAVKAHIPYMSPHSLS